MRQESLLIEIDGKGPALGQEPLWICVYICVYMYVQKYLYSINLKVYYIYQNTLFMPLAYP